MILDLLFPPRCLGCGSGVETQGSLCPACWSDTAFLSRPFCEACGYPFDFPVDDGARCAVCLATPPPYGRARSVMRYGDGARRLILAFKHGDRLEAAPLMARWLAQAGAELLPETDYIVPVPLHRWRLLQRRYNQSAVLALALGRITGKPVLPSGLLRVRKTPSQQGLKRRQRQENLRGAFVPRQRDLTRISGARLLLVDDVMTTGATVEACAKALLRAGAARVDVLTLARVVLPGTVII